MPNDTLKEIRPVNFSEDDAEIFDSKFRILCALNDQTIGERLAELMKADLEKFKKKFKEDWIPQSDLVDLLKKAGKTISRQTLRNHRVNGNLPAEYYIQSKIESDLPQAIKNQRTWYLKDKCLEFYKNNS